MMNGYHINKTQYVFFSKTLRANKGQAKSNKSCEWMVNTHRLGFIKNGTWFYSDKERNTILTLVDSQWGVDLLLDDFPQKRNRVDNAKQQSDEKLNALSVSHDFVLVNTLKQLCINGEVVNIGLLDSLGLYINATNVKSVEHEVIVFVENQAVMANLSRLVFTPNAAYLKDALWVYRGDLKPEQTTSKAYDFFRQFKHAGSHLEHHSHQLICFADVDPKGLEIALTCGASKLLAPQLNAFEQIEASAADQEYYHQDNAKKYIEKRNDLSNEFCAIIDNMKDHKKVIKQEHILAYQIPVTVYEIS